MGREQMKVSTPLSWAIEKYGSHTVLVEQIQGMRGRRSVMSAFVDEAGKITTIQIQVPGKAPWDTIIYGYGTSGVRHEMGSSFPAEQIRVPETVLTSSRLFAEELLPDVLDVQRTGLAFLDQMRRGDTARPVLYPGWFSPSTIDVPSARNSFWSGTPAANS